MNLEDLMAKLPQTELENGPVYAFSVHKSGSTMMTRMIADVCAAASIPSASIPDLCFAEGIPPSAWMNDEALLPAFQKKIVQYGFRFLPPLLKDPRAGIRHAHFVLLVRDPRDALVSEYFSYGKKSGSHARPKKNADAFFQKPSNEPDPTIDEYVLGPAKNTLLGKLRTYSESLNFDNGMLRRYEDVFFDKTAFLRDIFSHFSIDIEQSLIDEVAARHDVRPKEEDQSKHIRKGSPGDHREKLIPETIAELNHTFREVGEFYGYAL